MLLVIIRVVSLRHIALCSPIALCHLLRRVALSPLTLLNVVCRLCHRHCVASSPPCLTCLVIAVSCVTLLSCRHRPSPRRCWLIVVFVPSPTCCCRLLRCMVSPHASCRRCLASPVALLRCIVLIHRVVAVSRVASCPSLAVLPLPSLVLRHFLYLPRLFVGHAVVVASCHPRLEP
jgi:hypothetical protein